MFMIAALTASSTKEPCPTGFCYFEKYYNGFKRFKNC